MVKSISPPLGDVICGGGSELPIAVTQRHHTANRLFRALSAFPFNDGVLGQLHAYRSGTHQARDHALRSGLVDYSQKMTVAARAMAEKKTVGQRS